MGLDAVGEASIHVRRVAPIRLAWQEFNLKRIGSRRLKGNAAGNVLKSLLNKGPDQGGPRQAR
jgi:hypothetical protein